MEEVDLQFRQNYGRIVSTLTRLFGPQHLALLEEAVQDSLVRALEIWPFQGVPENPRAWLTQVARNKVLDGLRRDRGSELSSDPVVEPKAIAPLPDDELCMMFLCCHPALTREARIALTLKAVSGFSVREIARGFLAEEAAIAQRLVRAKRQILTAGLTFDMPSTAQIAERLDSVLEVLYLVFNEGYTAHEGDQLLRADLAEEAIRLTRMLPAEPKCEALLALMLLHSARNTARTGEEGELLLLKEQDRSQWNVSRIQEGLYYLGKSARGEALSVYHLQAGIAAAHAAAPCYEATDWEYIVSQFDGLYAIQPSPIVALNRAIALAQCVGPRAALLALENVDLPGYHLFYAAKGDFHAALAERSEAARNYSKALECRCTEPEKRLLRERLTRL